MPARYVPYETKVSIEVYREIYNKRKIQFKEDKRTDVVISRKKVQLREEYSDQFSIQSKSFEEKINYWLAFCRQFSLKLCTINFLFNVEGFKEDVQNVLDFGCGNGIYYHFIKKMNELSHWKYTGMDVDEERIRLAKRLFGKEHFHLSRITGNSPPLNETYDLVFLIAVIPYILEDVEKIVKDLCDAAGKYLYFGEMWLTEKEPQKYCYEVLTDNAQITPFHLYNKEQIIQMVEVNGFELIKCERSHSPPYYCYDSQEFIQFYNFSFKRKS